MSNRNWHELNLKPIHLSISIIIKLTFEISSVLNNETKNKRLNEESDHAKSPTGSWESFGGVR